MPKFWTTSRQYSIKITLKNCLKIPKGQLEAVNQRTDNTIIKRRDKKDNNLQKASQKTKD